MRVVLQDLEIISYIVSFLYGEFAVYIASYNLSMQPDKK